MKIRGFASLLILGLCACGGEESAPAGSDLLAPPTEGNGIQLTMVTEVEASSEVEHCRFVKAPDYDLYVNRDEVRFTKGSHHFLLYETSYAEIPTEKDNGTAVDTSGVFDCSDGATNGWSVRRLIGGSQNANAESIVRFPVDVAIKVKAGSVLLMNAHYVNPTVEQLQPEIAINLHTIDEQKVREVGDILFLYNPFIKVAAQGTSRARMRCPVYEDMTLTNIQSHMHARGVGYAISALDSSPFYENDAWEDVPVKSLGADGLSFKAGDILDYQCDYKNPSNEDIFQGPRASDEMCMAIGSFYPANEDTARCLAADGQGFAAEWVGNGTATCAETMLCAQDMSLSGGTLGRLAHCIQASAPEVSKEMTDAVRCFIRNGDDPLTKCATEFAACQAK